MIRLADDLYLDLVEYDSGVKFNCLFLRTADRGQILAGNGRSGAAHKRGLELAIKHGYVKYGGSGFSKERDQIYSYVLTKFGQAMMNLFQ